MTEDPAACFSEAETNVTKALSLAPADAAAHLVLGEVYNFTNRATQGIAECEHALRLDRNLAAAHTAIGMAKIFLGRPAETERHVLEAFRLSPRDIFAHVWMFVIGQAKIQLGANAEAADWLRRSIEANRNFPPAYFLLAAALALVGALDEARTAAKAALALRPGVTIHHILPARAFSDNPAFLAWLERFSEGLRLAGVPQG